MVVFRALGPEAAFVTIAFLAFMMLLGYYAYRKRVGFTLQDFFLASKLLGFLILGLSLFAVQYSGNSFIGYAAKSYRAGAFFLAYPAFMIALLIGILLLAPPLINLGSKRGYTSPGDFLEDRWLGYKPLIIITLICLFWGAFMQFFEQFYAMGYLGSELSGGVLSWEVMVILYSIAVIAYILLGGFRGAAIVQAVQGAIMLAGLVLMLTLLPAAFGLSYSEAFQKLASIAPAKVAVPKKAILYNLWYSVIVLVMLGAILYPQMIQHYLAVRNPKTLKRMITIMFPCYFFTATSLWLFGLFGAAVIPGLGKMESERVVPLLIRAIAGSGEVGYAASIVVTNAILCATLSTVGGCLIALGMLIAKDIYKRFVNPVAPEARAINISRICMIIIVIAGTIAALRPVATIWRLTEIKFELLMQAFTPVVLGLYLARLRPKPVFIGCLVGLVLAVSLTVAGMPKPYGIHAGLWGLIANLAISLGGSYLTKPTEEELRRGQEIIRDSKIFKGAT